MKRVLLFLNKKIMSHIDKIIHMSVCYSITYTLADKWNINAAIAIAILIGAIKEIWDSYNNGQVSITDIVADVLGIVLAYLIF
jgi:VanZ family protein